MPNALAQESSPYLLQHQDNPVDWRPWGPAALAAARDEDKPIFLSIGYAACHWCHVMEHESFEDERIAALVNEHFIAVKVDREERPDLDQIYMNAVQMMTGRGGWPMSVFLTPELKPFYAGTYFPPTARGGMPGFDDVLRAVHDAWLNRRDQVMAMSEQITAELQTAGDMGGDGDALPTRDAINGAVAQLARAFDPQHGGFGQAPKFPHPMDLQLCLRQWFRTGDGHALEMVRVTLDRMAAGGIYDHLGGGFARYSVDERWLVPHFEKMLYDNALLAGAYLEAFQATGDAAYERIVRETLDYVLRDMTDGAGGFHSTEDADSEGEEGLFYTWTPDELTAVLGEDAAETLGRVYDVTDAGNFEGRSILHLPKTIEQAAQLMGRDAAELAAELAASRAKLLAAREQRIRPGKDDKVLVSWNALAIDALARAGAVLAEPRYLQAARRAADFLLSELRRDDGRLLHAWRHGTAKLDAYLDDYAYLASALVTLFETAHEAKYLAAATELADAMLTHFADPAGGGFFFTADDHEQLIARNKDLTDSSVPAANGMAATALVRLGKLTGNAEYLSAAQGAVAAAADLIRRAPTATGQSLLALDLLLGPTYELVLAADPATDEGAAALAAVQQQYLPNKVFALAPPQASEAPKALADLLAGKEPVDGQPTLYVCEGFTCREPSVGGESIDAALDKLSATAD
ncbi:MAG: thioredoxin domain-containing protein [Planctomycetaceae bacterium]|nr:thioredoxin domain-containing protein [Planctomycetaceae bacterium]